MEYRMLKGNIKHSKENHNTWNALFERQLKLVEGVACKEWLNGFKRLELDPFHVPNRIGVSKKIQSFTDWKLVYADNEFLNNKQWFTALREKKFPTTNFIRKRSELDFTPFPDLFHEYFGHIPFLAVPEIAEITHLFGMAFFVTPKELRVGVGRLWWHTMEWGFVMEGNEQKVLGAGLLAGKNDLLDGLKHKKIPFSLEEVFNSSKTLNDVQDKYFIIDSVSHLKKCIRDYISKQIKNKGRAVVMPEGFDTTEEIEEFKGQLNK